VQVRGYGRTVRECEEAFAIEKSAVSEKFVTMSAKKVDELLKRDLGKVRLCALLLDGRVHARFLVMCDDDL
jgi:hypothetical protein